MAESVFSQKLSRFVRCRNCGVYIAVQDIQNGGYCSTDCTIQYSRCQICGRYYSKGVSSTLCSEACSIEYKFHTLRSMA